MHYFCTYFDRHYLSRAVTLHDSLMRHCNDFCLWALCFDDESYASLVEMQLPAIRPISLQEFEAGDTALAEAKSNRSTLEYYFTCTPSLPLFVLANEPKTDRVTYLDSDIYFFDSPDGLFEEIGDESIALIPHRFAPEAKDRERFGKYNVGWLTFRRDQNGLLCLR